MVSTACSHKCLHLHPTASPRKSRDAARTGLCGHVNISLNLNFTGLVASCTTPTDTQGGGVSFSIFLMARPWARHVSMFSIIHRFRGDPCLGIYKVRATMPFVRLRSFAGFPPPSFRSFPIFHLLSFLASSAAYPPFTLIPTLSVAPDNVRRHRHNIFVVF